MLEFFAESHAKVLVLVGSMKECDIPGVAKWAESRQAIQCFLDFLLLYVLLLRLGSSSISTIVVVLESV